MYEQKQFIINMNKENLRVNGMDQLKLSSDHENPKKLKSSNIRV